MPGALFVAVPGKGLVRFQDNRVETVPARLPGRKGTLHDLALDGEGGLWARFADAGHKTDGIYVRHDDAWTAVAGPQGEQDAAGACRIASAGGGDVHLICARAIYRRSAGTWIKIASNELQTAPQAAAVRRDGTIYIASPQEIFVFPPAGERAAPKRFRSPAGQIEAIAADERERIWLIGAGGELAVLNGAGDALVVPELLAAIHGATSLFVERDGPEEPRRRIRDGSQRLTGKLKGIDLDGAVAAVFTTGTDEDRHRTVWDLRVWRPGAGEVDCTPFRTDEVRLTFETPLGATPNGDQQILRFAALRKGKSRPFADEKLAVPGQAHVGRFLGHAGKFGGTVHIDVKLRDGKSRAAGETVLIDCGG
jgi:hypothetical protein